MNPKARSTQLIGPYLGLKTRLLLAWPSTALIVVVLLVVHLSMQMNQAGNGITRVKQDLALACLNAEKAANIVLSLPLLLTDSINHNIAQASNDAIDGLAKVLILALTATKAIILFVIDSWKSTYLCLIQFALRSSLGVVIGATQDFSALLNSTMNAIRTGIQDDVVAANNAITSAVSGINKVAGFAGVSLNIPQFDIPSLDSLTNVTVPTTFQQALLQLNASIPDLSTIRDGLDDILSRPFTDLQTTINSSLASTRVDSSLLPRPSQSNITFCAQQLAEPESTLDDLLHDVGTLGKVLIALLVLVAVSLIALRLFVAWWIASRHDSHVRDYLDLHNPKDGVLSSSTLVDYEHFMRHPVAYLWLLRLGIRKGWNDERRNSYRWSFSYFLHPNLLFCFLLGLFGLIVIQIQISVANRLTSHYSAQLATQVDSSTRNISTTMLATLNLTSIHFANESNTVINATEYTIDQSLFGWVNLTTLTLNSTINSVYTGLEDALTKVFNGTVLNDPLLQLLQCLVGSKVNAIEAALTWLNQNAHLSLPRVPDTILMPSAGYLDDFSSQVNQQLIGGDVSSAPVAAIASTAFNTTSATIKGTPLTSSSTTGPTPLFVSVATISPSLMKRQLPSQALSVGFMSSMTATSTSANVQSTVSSVTATPDQTGLVARALADYVQSLEQARVFYIVLLVIWLVLTLIGICIILLHRRRGILSQASTRSTVTESKQCDLDRHNCSSSPALLTRRESSASPSAHPSLGQEYEGMQALYSSHRDSFLEMNDSNGKSQAGARNRERNNKILTAKSPVLLHSIRNFMHRQTSEKPRPDGEMSGPGCATPLRTDSGRMTPYASPNMHEMVHLPQTPVDRSPRGSPSPSSSSLLAKSGRGLLSPLSSLRSPLSPSKAPSVSRPVYQRPIRVLLPSTTGTQGGHRCISSHEATRILSWVDPLPCGHLQEKAQEVATSQLSPGPAPPCYSFASAAP